MKREEITKEYVLSILDYDQITGLFTWRKWNKPAGSDMKTNCGKTYWRIGIMRNQCLAHRLAWLYVHGNWPDGEVDHIDGNGMNNAISNLRVVPPSVNMKNLRRSKRNMSGVTGISWDKGIRKWIAMISNGGKRIYLGCSSDFEEACDLRRNAEKDYGYHENHGSDRPL